jgi:hypothetical protein
VDVELKRTAKLYGALSLILLAELVFGLLEPG